ncbi:MAG TPA: substrate-binding domain-containing protein [Candidatus Limnocylindrales bacterium]|jgi:ribose transport system substrate-binding protein
MTWKRTSAMLGAFVVLLAACTGAPGGNSSRAQVIGFSQANGSDEWRTNQNRKVAENCNPVAQTLVSDALGDDATQSSHVDEFISRPVNVLLLTPNTAAGLTEAAKRAIDRKIPVITLDRSVDIEVTQHIGADNKLIGRTAAEYVSKTILGGNGGKVIEIQGTQGASATVDRHDEFVKWLQENDPKVEIVQSVDGDYKREKALTAMNDLLQAYGPGEVDVIYTHNDAMALGVVAALETAGRADEFKVVGIDGQNEAIQAIKDGKIVVTFTYDNAGIEACQTAAKLLKGETVDKQWVLPTSTIDAANVEEWIGKGF